MAEYKNSFSSFNLTSGSFLFQWGGFVEGFFSFSFVCVFGEGVSVENCKTWQNVN